MLGLPPETRGGLFDLDGVLTETAELHAAAWKSAFDAFLAKRAEVVAERFVPFDPVDDYDRFVDGKPREEGTAAFLASRGIQLPMGNAADCPDAETVQGLSRGKDDIVVRLFRERGVSAYPGSVDYVQAVRAAGLRTAVVSSSRHCRDILEAAKLTELFDARVDGVTAQQQHLQGKPAPDTYWAAAKALQLDSAQCAVFEDALAGVEAGRAGHFSFVVGVDRRGQAQQLRRHGADIVVRDLADLMRKH